MDGIEVISQDEDVRNLFLGFDIGEVTIPDNTSKVYKEKCVLSFHNTKSEKGLFVCLRTFLCFSIMYLDDYVKKTGNKLFLNISDQLKREGEISKFDIHGGKIVDFQDEDNFERRLSLVFFKPVKRYVVGLPSDVLPTKIQRSIEGVLKNESQTHKIENILPESDDDFFAPPDDLFPTRYSDNLLQMKREGWNEQTNILTGSAKCEKCELTTNLWFNLSDGFIGCGRRTFDGMGGNNHGLDHFKETGHPLATKLGTITAKSADVFSYAENCMVHDKNLDRHLRFFGIDRRLLRKTDDTMDEVNLDLNMCSLWNHVIFSESETDLKRPVFGPGLTGIGDRNSQINSILQVLFSTDEFRERFFDLSFRHFFENPKIIDPTDDLECMLVKMGNGLLSGFYSVEANRRQEIESINDVVEVTEGTVKLIESQQEEEEKHPLSGSITFMGGEIQESSLSKKVLLYHYIGQIGIKPLFPMFRILTQLNFALLEEGVLEDPAEFLSFLLHRISCGKDLGGSTSNFKFLMEERIQCCQTNQVRYIPTEETRITLEIDPSSQSKNPQEYQKYISSEEYKNICLHGPNSRSSYTNPVRPVFDFQNCINQQLTRTKTIPNFFNRSIQKTVRAVSSSRFRTFPKYLTVKIKDYYFNEIAGKTCRINPQMENVLELDISIFRGTGLQKKFEEEMAGWEEENDDDFFGKRSYSDGKSGEYELFAFITQFGRMVTSWGKSHFLCHIKKLGNEWVCFNDNDVTVCNIKNVQFDRGYIYFYRRKQQ